MLNSNSFNYVGVITGVIGAITGISGAIMGFVSYRRSGHMKALDLRIELRKSISDLHDSAQSLPSLLDLAQKSRIAIAADVTPNLTQEAKRELFNRGYEAVTAFLKENDFPEIN